MAYEGSIIYRKYLSPFYSELSKIFPKWVHPNHITLLGACFAILSNIALFSDYRWEGFILFTLYHMFDNMDGKHARRTGQSSEIGAILDHFVDGTAGIWGGAVGLQYGINVAPHLITLGVFGFTCLFWTVHAVHAYSGFFDLGGDYISIDELFLILSWVRLLYALDFKHIPIVSHQYFHHGLVFFIFASAATWALLYGPRINLSRVRQTMYIVLAFAAYLVITLGGVLQYAMSVGNYGSAIILSLFIVPYGLVLWESKDKH